MKKTIKTRIHTYRFFLDNAEDKAAWEELKAKLGEHIGEAKCFYAIGTHNVPYKDGEEVELKTDNLFDNQWNTADKEDGTAGVRVFDWWLEYMPKGTNRNLKQGHWLEQTEEMAEVRLTKKCGYCGHYEPADSELEFCPACLDSPYLSTDQLYLTRLLPVSCQGALAKLTEEEKAYLMPLYVHAQTVADGSRAVVKREKQRENVLAKYEEVTSRALVERNGMLWLLGRQIDLDSVIYYKHTGKFGFGWRSPLDKKVAEELRHRLEEFPFEYEIKER